MNTSLHNRLSLLRAATSAITVSAVLLAAGCSNTASTVDAEFVAPSAQMLPAEKTATLDVTPHEPGIEASLLAIAPPVVIERVTNEQGDVVYQRDSAGLAVPEVASRVVVAPGKYEVKLLAYCADFTIPEFTVQVDAKAGERYFVSSVRPSAADTVALNASKLKTRG